MFADYKVPQILFHLGILKLNSGLEDKLNSKKIIPHGSDEEVEIRAATIVAVEKLK